MTTTAWRMGLINALICGIGIFVVWSALVGVVALVSGRTLTASSGPAFTRLWTVVLIQYGAFRLYGSRTVGNVLLDCGPGPAQGFSLLLAAVFAFQGFSEVFASRDVPWWGLSIAAFYLSTAFGRLQIREDGIWQYGSLLRWHKIASYHWVDDGTLMLRAKGYLGLSRGALPVPLKHREAVNAFLLARAPQAREP